MIEVIEVLERNASDEVRAQAAAICVGLDPAKFRVSPFDLSKIDASPAAAPDELRALFSEKRPGVVHVHSSKSDAPARFAAKAAGVGKIFHSPHGGLLGPRPSAAARALSRLTGRGPAGVGTTVASSPEEAEAVRRLGGREAAPVVRDAYLGDFPEPLAHDGLLVGSCGRMTPERFPDAWVLLVQRLCDSRNGVKCAWIGGGEQEPKTHVDLTNMNLLMKISVTGWLAADLAREKLRGLDVFVQYAREGAGPGALLDAMALGLPVVASDISAHRDLVAEGATGFLVKTEIELLERCQQLLDDGGLRRRLGIAARDRVRRKFSRELMLAELSRLYSD